MSHLHFHDGALAPDVFRALRRKVVGLGSERVRSTYQTTFWAELPKGLRGGSGGLRLTADGLRLSVVELAALALFPLLPSARRVVGVEWWLSRMKTTNVMVDFHVDRDEKLALRTGRIVSPVWSSVLFLNRSVGGLLAVTDQPPNEDNLAKAPDVLDLDLAEPRPNRFVVFDGRLTHGVLDADNAIPGRRIRRQVPMRYAVIFNWWDRRPEGVPVWGETSVYRSLAATNLGRG